jgi:dihydrodipicolinate synthase/N-acetylneuraminate lyase
MLTKETFIGPWAGLPVVWNEENKFEEDLYRDAVRRCCKAGIPGVYTGGTTGEFYAMDYDEFQAVSRSTVEECHANGTPAMIGCTSTYTLGAIRRAAYAAEIGADAIQVALPFWVEVDDREVVPFFEKVNEAAGGIPVSIYETKLAKKVLRIDQHRAIKAAVPSYLMVKANEGTVGATIKGCSELSEFLNVFVSEPSWLEFGPVGAIGCCSSMVYWNPRVVLDYWGAVKSKNWKALEIKALPFKKLLDFLISEFGQKAFTDTAYDRMGGAASGFLCENNLLRNRKPYTSATEKDIQILRDWYKNNFPEMLEL